MSGKDEVCLHLANVEQLFRLIHERCEHWGVSVQRATALRQLRSIRERFEPRVNVLSCLPEISYLQQRDRLLHALVQQLLLPLLLLLALLRFLLCLLLLLSSGSSGLRQSSVFPIETEAQTQSEKQENGADGQPNRENCTRHPVRRWVESAPREDLVDEGFLVTSQHHHQDCGTKASEYERE